MKQAIGFLEYRSIAVGIEATDAMLKSGNVKLIQNSILCPGKYITMIGGEVGSVESAIRVGANYNASTCIDSFVIPNIHESIFPALNGTTAEVLHGSLGIVETVDAASAIIGADAAVKAAAVTLLEIRLARGMGGKSLLALCGELTAVQTAVNAAAKRICDNGLLIATSVISSPHKDLRY